MKTAAGLLLLVILALSCKEEEEKTFAPIEGQWRGTHVEIQVKPFGLPIPFSDEDDSFDTVIEFKADRTMVVHGDQPTAGTYQIIGDQLVIDIDLTIEDRELAGTYKLETLSETSLVFSAKHKKETLADPDGGPALRGDIKLTLHFQKVN